MAPCLRPTATKNRVSIEVSFRHNDNANLEKTVKIVYVSDVRTMKHVNMQNVRWAFGTNRGKTVSIPRPNKQHFKICGGKPTVFWEPGSLG